MLNTIEHVQNRDGEYYVANTRIPVGVVIAAFKRGDAPDRIVEQFPTLTLADVYGVITYYLDHQQELEAHFAALTEEFERLRLEERAKRPAFYDDLRQRIETWRAARGAMPDQPDQPDESAE